MKTKIKKVGFEIEGEFSRQLISELELLGKIKGDGSLRHCDSGYCNQNNLQLAEFNSEPFLPTSTKLDKFFVDLQSEYKKKRFHFNATCGFHIHISFSPVKPLEIFSEEFVSYFIDCLKKQLPDVVERRKESTYCIINKSDEQLSYNLSRYRAVNIYPSFSSHRTIELRIFPSDEPLKMLSYVKFAVRTVQNFIEKGFERKFDEILIPVEHKCIEQNIEVIIPNLMKNICVN